MMKLTLAILLSLSAVAWARENPNPADYTVNVHVSRSRNKARFQELNVVINGRNYELRAYNHPMMLALGDYKAKLVKDEHRGSYDSFQVYEFLFPDQETRKFDVVGQTE